MSEQYREVLSNFQGSGDHAECDSYALQVGPYVSSADMYILYLAHRLVLDSTPVRQRWEQERGFSFCASGAD